MGKAQEIYNYPNSEVIHIIPANILLAKIIHRIPSTCKESCSLSVCPK